MLKSTVKTKGGGVRLMIGRHVHYSTREGAGLFPREWRATPFLSFLFYNVMVAGRVCHLIC